MEVSDTDGLERLRSEMQSRLEARAGEAVGKRRIVCHAVPGSAADVILDVALQVGAGLILVGATRRGKLAGAILGTTAQRVLRASPLPVLVNRRPPQGRPRRVLLTTDLSELSAAVYERALALVTMLWGSQDLEVRSLFVAGDDLPLPPIGYQFTMRDQAEQRLGAFLEQMRPGETAVEGKVRLGRSARKILVEAKEWGADLLVLGSRGRTGTSRLLIGSVAETVMRKASCDVLLIPAAAIGHA
jgi:nucleotide-binding universal stress UspA family protein